MSHNLSEFEDRIFEREAAVLELELNETFHKQLEAVNNTISL